MSRALSISNLYSKKFDTMELTGIYKEVLGSPERSGIWLIWGNEKNGKTWGALQLADYLSTFYRVLYISGEEGISKEFVDSVKRAGLMPSNRRVQLLDYISYEELIDKLEKRKSADLIFIDNCTVYKDEISFSRLRELVYRFPQKLFVFLAHEERNEPYTALAKLVKKLSKVIFYIEGLRATVSGRVPGGIYDIDTLKSQLYHGNEN